MGLARLLILFSALVAGCASQQPAEAPWPEAEPLAGSFISCPQEERLKKEKLPRKLKGSGYILFGEGHTNKCDHQVQAKLVRIMAESGKRFCIGLEMVTANMQPVLDRFNSGDLDLADLQGRLDWANNWGYDYGFYSRIFELAREHDLPVFGLNLPSEVVRTVSRQGLTGLDKEQKKHLPQKIIP
ncbi:MAG: ChaN family lipoprotein, partial [Desulfonatronovibrionaceae bacterium]